MTDARVSHGAWKDVIVSLPTDDPVNGLRIDFYSALTTIEIAEIEICVSGEKAVYRAATAADFGEIALFGDCVACSLDPFKIGVTGTDPQLHLPTFGESQRGLVVKMRLRVDAVA
jgi:hypothetical protein